MPKCFSVSGESSYEEKEKVLAVQCVSVEEQSPEIKLNSDLH